MKITIDLEKELVEMAKREIEKYYFIALTEAQAKAEKDMDKISRQIIKKVKEAIKDLKIK